MKVHLQDLRLGVSALTESVHVGVVCKDKITWKHKKDVHNDFLHAVVDCWRGQSQRISLPSGKVYEVTVKEITE